MAKDAYYFSHDSNAKDDPKCVFMIEQMGLEGFGIYWVLVEILRDQPTYRYPLVLIPAIARRYNTTAEKMKIVINGYGLFEVDENEFFSISLMNRMSKMDAIRDKRSMAGKISATKRIAIAEHSTSVEQVLNKCITNDEQGKEKKLKEKKEKEIKNKYGEYLNVLLTDTEYNKLLEEQGQENLNKIIDFFDKYIEEKGTKYKNHYLAIKRWVVDAVVNQTKLFGGKSKKENLWG